MKQNRFFRLVIPLLAGMTICLLVLLALSERAPVAAGSPLAPVVAPAMQTYTGNLQFDDIFIDQPTWLEGDIYIYSQPQPLKMGLSWMCNKEGCLYNGALMYKFAATGATAGNIVVCVSGELPGTLYGGCEHSPPDTMYFRGCVNSELTENCGGDHFPKYWSDKYGLYCYDLEHSTRRPYPKEVFFGQWLRKCPGGSGTIHWYVTVVEVDGYKTDTTTDCVEVENVTLTGPPTATTGIATPYELSWSTSEPGEVEIEIMVDVGGIATGPVWGEQDEYYREFFINWLIQGVHTVTARVETPCSYGEDSVTTEVTNSAPFTGVIPLLPIGDCETDDSDSACYLDCSSCPPGDHLWDIGGWIEWLLCWLICLFQWLGRVILWIELAMVNALIGVFNIVLTWNGDVVADIIHWVEWESFTWSNFVEQTFANLGDFISDHILVARDWMYTGLTWMADQFEIGGDLLGDNLESFFTELGEWSETNLTEFGQMANESITNWGASRSADIDHFRDWSYEGLLELADYFSGWGTGLGNFLALCVTVFADFWYWILTQISIFVRDFTDALGNMVEGVMIKLGQFLYILIVSIGKLLNAFFTKIGLFIAIIIRKVRDLLYAWMTVLAYAVDAFFTGLGRFLGMVIRAIADFAILLVLAFNALMAGLSYALQLALVLAQAVVDAILEVYGIVIWFSELVSQLLDALIGGLQSDSTPEMYTGAAGLYYFWEGLSFFETISESSPLAALNTIAIAFIGINLLFWTFRQIFGVVSDLLAFS